MVDEVHNDCDGGFCVVCSRSSEAAEVECDELKCPACADAPVMTVTGFTSDEVDDGTVIVCRGCGFQVAGCDEAQVSAAVEMLWDYGLPLVGNEGTADENP